METLVLDEAGALKVSFRLLVHMGEAYFFSQKRSILTSLEKITI